MLIFFTLTTFFLPNTFIIFTIFVIECGHPQPTISKKCLNIQNGRTSIAKRQLIDGINTIVTLRITTQILKRFFFFFLKTAVVIYFPICLITYTCDIFVCSLNLIFIILTNCPIKSNVNTVNVVRVRCGGTVFLIICHDT